MQWFSMVANNCQIDIGADGLTIDFGETPIALDAMEWQWFSIFTNHCIALAKRLIGSETSKVEVVVTISVTMMIVGALLKRGETEQRESSKSK